MARPIHCSNEDGQLAIVTFTEVPDGDIHAYCLNCWVAFCLIVAQAAGWVPDPNTQQPAPSTDADAAEVVQLPPVPDPLTGHRVKRGAAARHKRAAVAGDLARGKRDEYVASQGGPEAAMHRMTDPLLGDHGDDEGSDT